jgi:hypothetical protein
MSTEQAVANINAAHAGERPNLVRDPLAIREPITSPSLSLHPAVIEALDGYDTDKGYVQPALDAFTKAHQSIERVINARTTINQHSDLSTEQKVIKIAELADKLQVEVTQSFDSALKRLEAGIKSYEETLSGPLEQKAGIGTLNTEMREHCKSLNADKREQFLLDALENKDAKTLLSICGAAPYLSGLTRERHALLTRQYHLMTNPDIEKRMQVMTTAKRYIEERGGLIFGQFESAIGWKREKVVQAKERQKAVADALKTA